MLLGLTQCRAVCSAIPPFLLLCICFVLFFVSSACGILAIVLLWLVYPREVRPCSGAIMLVCTSQPRSGRRPAHSGKTCAHLAPAFCLSHPLCLRSTTTPRP